MNSGNEGIKALLDQARQAINASNAEQALQCVVEAVKLLNGDNAVIPVLRSAAQQYHAQRSAPIDELSALLSNVSLQVAQQDQQAQQQQSLQQQQAGPLQQHAHTQQQLQSSLQPVFQMPASCSLVQQQLLQEQQQQQQQQQWQQQQHANRSSSPILKETGRGAFTDMALADGSSWQCPHCGGVVLQERMAAHLQHWCPRLGGTASP